MRIYILRLVIGSLITVGSINFILAQDSEDTVVVAVSEPDNTLKAKGMVADAFTGLPLGGIRVTVTDFSATLTNDDGSFSIKIPNSEVTINVRGQGYQQKEIALKGRNEINVSLYEENFNSVYDLVQLPTQEKAISRISNSVVSINTSNKWQTSSETPENYLQGKIPGINITRRSGTQGIGGNLFLRGFSSLNGSNQPLIVVDGMIYDMNNYSFGSIIKGYFSNPLASIDVKDIDNITIIKDASGYYGAKGANGVILITTSHAKEQATKIEFAAYGGINFAPKNIPVMNSTDFRVYQADVLKSKGYSDEFIQSQVFMNDDSSNPNYYSYHNNTDWQKEVLKNSKSQNYYLKVTGGDNIAKYALSMGFLNHQGIITGSDFSRYNTRFNADLNMSPRLTVNTNLSFTYGIHNVFNEGLSPTTSPLYLSLTKAPYLSKNEISSTGLVSPNLANVDIFNIGNPVAIIDKMSGKNDSYRFFGSAKFNYKISNDVNASTLFGITYDKTREAFFIPKRGVLQDTIDNAIVYSRMGSQLQRTFSVYSDSKVSYNKLFQKIHRVKADVGLRYVNNLSEEDYALGFNSATDELQTIGKGQNSLRQVGGGVGRWKWVNYYIGLDYELKDKYILALNMTMDGSSRFGKNIEDPLAIKMGANYFGLFPSIGAAWIVSSENFMADINKVDFFKLRATYGISGNDDIGNYASKQLYVSQNLIGLQGIVPGGVANTSLQWETNKKLNVGFDLSTLNERLSISFDAYKNTIDNMIVNETAPAVSGTQYIVSNSGAMKNKGIEVGINGRILNKVVKWDLGFNIATNRNRLTEMPVLDNGMLISYAGAEIQSKVGQPVGVFYGYKAKGIYTSDEEASNYGYEARLANGVLLPFRGGDVRFEDVNGDQIIDNSDKQVIGNPNPDFTGMISTRLEWKRFTLDGALNFCYGNEVYNYTRAELESLSGLENQSIDAINRWRVDGQNTDVPRALWGDPMGNSRFSDRWIEDGSYLRLRSLSLAYNLPIKPKAIKAVTVYCTGNNLLTFTNYLGYDPEFSASRNILLQGIDNGQTPQFKSFLVGFRLGL